MKKQNNETVSVSKFDIFSGGTQEKVQLLKGGLDYFRSF